MRSSGIFPNRLFRWFVSRQVLTSGLLLVVLDVAILLWLEQKDGISPEALQLGRELILISLVSALSAMVAVSLIMARRLVIPLGRLVDKTRRLRKFPFENENFSDEELAYDEPGEWYDLERALNKLGRDLRNKTIRLSREKTELRAIMASVSEAILAINDEKRPLFYNSQFALMFKLQEFSADQMHLQEIIRSPDVLAAYDRCLKEGQGVKVETTIQVLEDSEPHTFEVGVTPLKKKHNQEIYGAVALFHDISEMKKAEQIRIEFVGNVSHELRTPLTSIHGYLQTVMQDFQQGRFEQCGEFLAVIDKNVNRLKLLVNDLLDLSSLESGAKLSKGRVSTQELTEQVLAEIGSRQHIIQMHYGVQEFKADSSRVAQVLRNLLQNAVRYVPAGRHIDVYWDRNEKGSVLLRVKDDGPGIPLKHQARLFERFYRIDEARSREVGGTGIGLSLVKHIMFRHGGSVWVESEPGRGAEFVCEFPQNPAPPAV
jgi:two-component system phosphate regulon sensor histidine kinase PhoR